MACFGRMESALTSKFDFVKNTNNLTFNYYEVSREC